MLLKNATAASSTAAPHVAAAAAAPVGTAVAHSKSSYLYYGERITEDRHFLFAAAQQTIGTKLILALLRPAAVTYALPCFLIAQ
eukprot:9368-Heterococcus_DN1.PRE.2